MNLIRIFSKPLFSFRHFAIAVSVVLIAAVTTPGVFAQSSSRPSQGSSSRPSQGSSFKGRQAPSYGGSSAKAPPGSSSKSTSEGSGSSSAFPQPGGSSDSFPKQRSSGSSSKSPSQGANGSSVRGGQANPYLKIVLEIQKNESEINRLYSSIPIGFPGKQKQFLDRVNILKAKNVELKSKLDAAAVQAYRQDPQKNPRAGQLIYRQMLQKIDPRGANSHFDPQGALEIADVLIEGGLNENEAPGPVRMDYVAYQAFRASYAIQDFERADLMLKIVAEQGTKIRPEIPQTLQQTRERWQQELKIRRLESNTDDLPKVKFETTEGDFLVELFENHAPETVANFVDLVEKKFYNDMPFFLVRPGDFAQTGCPNGDGTGDAGYKIACECYREQIRYNFAGTLNMVHEGSRDTGGSQFFISHQPNQKWDQKYTAFGRVKEGMDVVYKLQTVDKTTPDPAEIEPSKIIKATVVWKRDHKYEATRIQITDVEPQDPIDPSDYLNQLQNEATNGG